MTQKPDPRVLRFWFQNGSNVRINLIDPFLKKGSSKYNNRLKSRYTNVRTPRSKERPKVSAPVQIKDFRRNSRKMGRGRWRCFSVGVRFRGTLKVIELTEDDGRSSFRRKFSERTNLIQVDLCGGTSPVNYLLEEM